MTNFIFRLIRSGNPADKPVSVSLAGLRNFLVIYSVSEVRWRQIGATMFNPSRKIALSLIVGCIAWSCAPIKETGRTIGHTTRDVTKEIGHGARDVTREIGHGTRDVVKDIGEGTRDAVKAGSEEVKKVVKPSSEQSEY